MKYRLETPTLYGMGTALPSDAIIISPPTAKALGFEKTVVLEILYRDYAMAAEYPDMFTPLGGTVAFERVWFPTSKKKLMRRLPFLAPKTVGDVLTSLVSEELLSIMAKGDPNDDKEFFYSINLEAIEARVKKLGRQDNSAE